MNNFTLRDSEMDAGVTRFGNTAASGTPEGAIIFGNPTSGTGLRGTGLIEGNVIGSGSFDNLDVYNFEANSLNLTIRDSATTEAVFNDMLSGGNDGILVQTGGGNNLTLLVGGEVSGDDRGVQFTGVYGDHIQTNAVNGATTQNITIDGNIFTQSLADGPFVAGGGVRIGGGSEDVGTNINVNYVLSDNIIRGARDSAFDGRFNGRAGTITGVVLNNTVGTDNGVFDTSVANRGAGFAGEVGMFIGLERGDGSGNMTYALRIQDNDIHDTPDQGIYLISQNSAGGGLTVVEATILNNVIDELGAAAFGAMRLLAGGGSTGENGRMGTVISGNTFDVTGVPAIPGLFYDQVPDAFTHHYVPGIGGPHSGVASDTALTNFLNNVNDPGPDTQNNFIGTADLIEGNGLAGLTGENLTLPVPILAAPPAGEDWETAFHDWLASLPASAAATVRRAPAAPVTAVAAPAAAAIPAPAIRLRRPSRRTRSSSTTACSARPSSTISSRRRSSAGSTPARPPSRSPRCARPRFSVADMTGVYLGTSDAGCRSRSTATAPAMAGSSTRTPRRRWRISGQPAAASPPIAGARPTAGWTCSPC